jgi:hypothetical protein
VLCIALGRQVAAQSHRDRPGGDLGQAGRDHDMTAGDGSGESGGQRKGHRQPIRPADDDIADCLAAREVFLDVWCL